MVKSSQNESETQNISMNYNHEQFISELRQLDFITVVELWFEAKTGTPELEGVYVDTKQKIMELQDAFEEQLGETK